MRIIDKIEENLIEILYVSMSLNVAIVLKAIVEITKLELI